LFLLGNPLSWTHRSIAYLKGRTKVPTQYVSDLLKGSSGKQVLYEPMTRSFVPVRDARNLGGSHVVPRREIDLFLQHSEQRRARSTTRSVGVPPPGGLGAGVSYLDELLHFQNYTAVYFYLVAPPTIGLQSKAQLLYMTSSNTASKGCEALLSFFTDEQDRCAFRIWDWAHPDVAGGGKFIKNYVYEEIQPYLIPYRFALETGTELDTVCIYIANITRQTKGSAFQNDVYLQNHMTGTRDLIWSYPFDWPDKATSDSFWWGPIFETFPDPGALYALANPVGFDQTTVIQDGAVHTLSDQNSSLSPPANNGLEEIYRSTGTNGGLVCDTAH
jgi:hypothetical protein